jgi:hypothetical protein
LRISGAAVAWGAIVLNGKTREIVQDILSTAGPEPFSQPPVINFSGISGNGHTFHVHITTGGAPPCWQPDTDRDRRLAGIAARCKSVPNAPRKCGAYLKRSFGVERADELCDADLVRYYAWVHSLPTVRSGA